MFYPESDTIASDHPDLADQVRSVDKYLYDLGEQPFRLEPTADLLDLEPGPLKRLLRLYESHGVVEQVEILICPEDGEILEADEEGGLWCDVCEADYQPDECERETVYRVRPGSITPMKPPVKATAQIFLSYAREDREKVESLYQALSEAGFKPWMDTRDILPGEQWRSSIQRAVRGSDFFLACLSRNSVGKRGWIQREVREALDTWQEMLDSDIYLIPVRLEDCDAPDRLRDFQWVDLFEEDGWTRLVEAIRVGIERRAETASSAPPA
jgi:hypothetical protein